jgi:magnesium transporter
MKLISPGNCTAPSPAVLDFLRSQVRNAFESPTTRCAASKLNGRGYRHASTCAREGYSGARVRSNVLANGGNVGGVGYRTAASPRTSSNSQRPMLHARHNRGVASRANPDPLVAPFSGCRGFSTTQYHGWRLWPTRQRQLPAPSLPPISPLAAVTEDTVNGLAGLGRTTRPANELKMRCTELDEHGNVTMVSGEFKKSELIAKVT